MTEDKPIHVRVAEKLGWQGVYQLGPTAVLMVTGGWSENEAIIANLPPMFRVLYWYKSERGGLHVFKLPLRLRFKKSR